ncbi:MAG: TRAP transporter large permease [Pseudolabrys sp.]
MAMVGLVGLFFVFLALSIPIAFAMGLAGIIGILTIHPEVSLELITERIFGSIDSFTLLAIPFFLFTGETMAAGGISHRLVNLARLLVGHIRGGLGHTVMVSGVFLAGVSGSHTADAAVLSTAMVPTLEKAGYKPSKAAALVCAAAGMTILMPPSLSIVVYGGMTNTSIAILFMAGVVPTILTTAALMLHIYIEARFKDVHIDIRATWRQTFHTFLSAFLSLLLPIIILVGIRGGAVTPTEAAVVAAFYALAIGMFAYRTISLREFGEILLRTGHTTGVIMLLIGAAGILSWLLALEQVPQMIASWFKSTGGGQASFMVLSIVIFVLLFALLDGLPAMLMVIPIFVPLAKQLGIEPMHYGIIMIAATGVALFLPPIGVGFLVVVKTASVPMGETGWALIPYLGTMFLVCLLLAFAPDIAFVLPRLLGMM